MKFREWEGFQNGMWTEEVDVRGFIQANYTPYDGDDSFLAGPTEGTKKLWDMVMDLTKKEREAGGVLDADSDVPSTVTSHGPGYLEKSLEKVVGLQTDKPFKRALMPWGGINMAIQANESYGFQVSDRVKDIFTNYRKTHNQGVFDAYTPDMRKIRKSHIVTGLPDTYGRGRIIGDYRRLALYGTDFLIAEKQKDALLIDGEMFEEKIRLREEITEQIRALKDIQKMAQSYGFDVSKPAANAIEAFNFTYLAYLAAIKQNNGAAESFGRTATFLDIYIERDIKVGILTEEQAQELVDHMVMKLRIVKFTRTPAYNEIFSGDPVWATESIGGMGLDGRTLVTKNCFRFIHTLANMGPSPEPNLTILWSNQLPDYFKEFCAKYSILYSSMQYENDDIMRTTHGDDYAIACCVSPMKVGKQMQFFGARTNLAKTLLYAVNGGIDEISGEQISPRFEPIATKDDEPLNFDEVYAKFDNMMTWVADKYVNTLNVIHYMHDKYYYESAEMCFYDTNVHRFFATGIAGLSVVADSLSAIKYAKVYPVRDERGIITSYRTEGDFPKFGNDDSRVDDLAKEAVRTFMNKIRSHHTYRNSEATMSVLTITSNVVYGKSTGDTPCGRRFPEAFAPGANPMHGRDCSGAVASLASVSKIPFKHAADGISNTFSVIPNALGKDDDLVIAGDFSVSGDIPDDAKIK
ncbi:formate C-acetyltransferase [Spiroplasma culicicola]|uniref:Formate acetyltransferase n=1 Tax=Spiroplasma culicicola AES-1 TaxID=1276246 RepID=W6A806_9MOLU|nr:formate C-acetyltransferase [Spiroplasma culicicola]AHI53258.1 formate C-acetyltransferase [Spiroplasma culicicola AES-1]